MSTVSVKSCQQHRRATCIVTCKLAPHSFFITVTDWVHNLKIGKNSYKSRRGQPRKRRTTRTIRQRWAHNQCRRVHANSRQHETANALEEHAQRVARKTGQKRTEVHAKSSGSHSPRPVPAGPWAAVLPSMFGTKPTSQCLAQQDCIRWSIVWDSFRCFP